MSVEVVAILNNVASMFLDNMMFHSESKDVCHQLNMQGFKRWHRYNAEEDRRFMEDLKDLIVENYNVLPTLTTRFVSNVPNDLMVHFQRWEVIETYTKEELNKAINQLCNLNANYEATYLMNKLACVEKELQKVKRYKKRMADTGMNMHDIYIISMHLHKKYKYKERDGHKFKR